MAIMCRNGVLQLNETQTQKGLYIHNSWYSYYVLDRRSGQHTSSGNGSDVLSCMLHAAKRPRVWHNVELETSRALRTS